jgi:hypothetical protein
MPNVLSSLLSSLTRLASGKVTDESRYAIIIDLNDTIVHAELGDANDGDIVVGAIPYRLAYGAVEFLACQVLRAALAKRKVDLSFVASNKEHGHAIVEQLRQLLMSLGVEPFEYSVHCYTEQACCEGLAATPKHISELPGSAPLARTLIIDDSRVVLPKAQQQNLLQVVSLDNDAMGLPNAYRLRARYNLVRAAGILALSWEQQTQQDEDSWLRSIAALQWAPDECKQQQMSHSPRLYERGLELLRESNRELWIEPEHTRGGREVYPWQD